MVDFLSNEWFSKVNELYKTAGDLQMPDSLTSVTVNLTVKTDKAEVEMAINKGIIQKGFVDGADVDMSMPAEYAYKILVLNDWSVGMRGYIKRHIKLSGKMAKLFHCRRTSPASRQSSPATRSPNSPISKGIARRLHKPRRPSQKSARGRPRSSSAKRSGSSGGEEGRQGPKLSMLMSPWKSAVWRLRTASSCRR